MNSITPFRFPFFLTIDSKTYSLNKTINLNLNYQGTYDYIIIGFHFDMQRLIYI